ncbi:MAG: UDP-N-acetylmuramate dehydrogenase [Candidatus Shapirobacteria bacterium]|nr:UDP-N-acetylmuramate dehydrogenase [Candidatus Shapirobacteria bacterium]
MNFDTLKSQFPDLEIYQNHLLAPYTTLNIGGPADIFINTKTSTEFVNVLKYLSETINFSAHSDPKVASTAKIELSSDITILGNGSNVLISDSGIRGIVVKNSANNIEFLPNNQIKVDSGVLLPRLLQVTTDHSLSGLEEFAYIPASVGGAIFGNIHGVNKNNFDKFIVSVEALDLNDVNYKLMNHSDIQWDYDYSSFQPNRNLIIVSATLQLSPGVPENSQKIINDIVTQKTTTQSMNSVGCVFKNPPGDSAGRIIDQELNLKGFQIGDVQISPKHANFILNIGNATASDYLSVIKKVQSEAKSKGFLLEPEIKFLGEF